jgi:catecholate siderophore receptor
MRRSVLVLATSFIALAAPAAADSGAATTAEAAAQPGDEDKPIIVEGERSSYGAERVTSATKTSTEVKDIPQALTIVTKAQIDDQQLRSVSDLLLFVPGASPATGESNRDQFTLRGNNTTADLFINGIRDDVQYFRDFYNVARVEVLKGPNAMIFGRGGGGGVINRVTKVSTLTRAIGGDVSVDSFGGVRLTGDVDMPLSPLAGLRVNALYENGDSFRRHVDLERYGIAPTVGIEVGDRTRIDLAYEYFHDRRTADRGVPSASDGNAATVDSPLGGFDRTFFGDPDKSFSRADVHLASAVIEHDLGGGWSIRNRTQAGDYDKFYQNIYPNGPATPAGTVVLAAYNDTTKRRNLFSQTDFIWEGRLAGADHTFLAGFELGGSEGRNQRRNGRFPGDVGSVTVPLTDPTVDLPVTFVANGNNSAIDTKVAALYVQDQIRPTDWLEIVAGLRFDRVRIVVDNLATGQEFARTDSLFSPRLGLVLKPLDNLSLYASYSRSYLPQSGDQFNSLNLTGEGLKPERFDNYELGAKWEPLPGLLATAAIYQLDRSNTQARDPANPLLTVLTGQQRSRGLELGLERSITHRWQVSAGYALQDAEITETTTAAPAGRKVPLVPRHSASLWTKYDLTQSLGLGLGVVARSKSYASLSNQVKLPGYARVDAAAYYKVARGLEAQLNVENLFGADYFVAAHNDNNIAPGAPRSARLTLRFGM